MINDTATIHEVSDYALADFLARIAKLSKKSEKILGKPITPIFHGDVVREVTVNGKKFDIEGNPFVRVFHRVSVSGESPKINGWTFCATIDHAHVAGNLIRSVPGAPSVPVEYRTAEPFCDHCNKLRRRNDTFILRCDADGTFMQIGRQCIRDFIGYDVTTITESAKWLSGLEPSETDGEGGYGGFSGSYISLVTFLAHVHAVIRINGWVSKKDAEIRQSRSTSSAAMENMFPLPRYRHLAVPLTTRDHEVALQAYAYAQNLTGRTDYEYNLSIVAKDEYITYKSVGLAASMVPALFRHQETELKRAQAAKGSDKATGPHLGKLNERLRGVSVTVEGYKAFENSYGSSHLFRMRSGDSVVLWWASSAKELAIGDKVVLDGTVKKHDVYNGVYQTTLTRCNISRVKE